MARRRVLTWLASAFLIGQAFTGSLGRIRARAVQAHAEPESKITKVEICIHRDCKRRGGGQKLKSVFEELADGTGIEVGEYDCFDECPFGPNVRTLEGPDDQFGRVLNGVKGKAQIAKILGVEPPEEP
ncbi:unnamed protein product [Effrenium voratum]|uniref:(2Fe-2S) ferredoxin domain-containing protein n=1 Tax=Effrenium voratum TaxID=2562239 RepID=A0AA36NJH0_9DINO|nr:unnamed protein product [Effrenium voratum]